MGYLLGVDLGTTSTSAAVARGGRAATVQLTADSQVMPSVVSVRDDGDVLCGEVAERRAVTDPSRTIREFKRRFGDPAPVVLGGKAYGADELTGHLLADVIARTTTVEGEAPTRLGLSHPAAWGPFRLELLRKAAAQAGHDSVILVPEPVAAAIANRDRIQAGALVAVYDLGGGTFDAAVVRQGPEPEVVGTPEGIERLGGVDIDLAVLAHVDAVLDGQVVALDSTDPEARAALARLRADCQAAKESLSSDTDVEIPVHLPGLHTSVRLTRADLESLVRPRLADTLAVLDRVVASAGVAWKDIASVLLVGGSSRMPLVGQMVAEHTGRPVTAATNPTFAISIGTALAIAADEAAAPAAAPVPSVPATAAPVAATPPVAPAPAGGRKKTPLLAAAAVAAAAVVGVGAFTALGGADDDAGSPTTTAQPTDTTQSTGSPTTTAQPTDTTQGTDTTQPTGTTGSSATEGGVPLRAVTCDGTLAADGPVGVGSDALFATVGDEVVRFPFTASGTGCAVDPAGTSVTVAGSIGAVRQVRGSDQDVLAVTGAAGTAVIRVDDGSATECPELQGVAVPGPGNTLLAWSADGPLQGYDVGRRGCNLVADDILPGASVTAGAVVGRNQVLAGAVLDGATAPAVVRLDGPNVRWSTAIGPGTIDAVGECGDLVCAIGSGDAGVQVTVLDADGTLVGVAPLADVLGVPVERFNAGGTAAGGAFAVVTTNAGVITISTITP
jgi:molecular chaperone DnaK